MISLALAITLGITSLYFTSNVSLTNHSENHKVSKFCIFFNVNTLAWHSIYSSPINQYLYHTNDVKFVTYFYYTMDLWTSKFPE